MDGNFKVRCVDNVFNVDNYTIGKIYEFHDGYMTTDSGMELPFGRERIDSFEEWVKYSSSKWVLVDESDKEKAGGFIHCKICKRRFELKKSCRYTTSEVESIFLVEALLHDAFDCPHCGCQNIVGIRESEVKSNE